MKGEEGRNAVRKTAILRYQFYHRAVGIGKTFKAYLRPVTKSMEKNMFLSFLMGTVHTGTFYAQIVQNST